MSTEQFIKISKTKLLDMKAELQNSVGLDDDMYATGIKRGKIQALRYILKIGQPVEQISDEDIECAKWCGMNYCDENGCVNRKRHLVDIEPTEKPDSEWLTEKPTFNKECLFVTATKWNNDFKYHTWRIVKSTTEDKDYLELFTGEGSETPISIEDLEADYYKIISPINK